MARLTVKSQKDLTDEIIRYCLNDDGLDPFELYNQIVRIDGVPMHGPIHHFIIPAVLLTIFHNHIDRDKVLLDKQLIIALERANIVPGAFCANFGACGAGLGVGIFFSILTDNKPLSEESWRDVMMVTSESLALIAKHGGPRCCKRDSYLSLQTAINVLNEKYNINVIYDAKIACAFSNYNSSCKKESCLYYK